MRPLESTEYTNENELQKLVADHPQLISGFQIDKDQSCDLMLIKREMGIANGSESSDRWSVDHLFVDRMAIPTLVEIKRSSDSRSRRQVVGQMLDYAANAVKHWPAGRLRREFENYCDTSETDPDEKIKSFARETPEQFWNNVDANLEAGRIRLIFVLDNMQPELLSIVEFLNEQMPNVHVIAIEIQQFKNGNTVTLIPRVHGNTSRAVGSKQPQRATVELDVFLDTFHAKHGEACRDAALRIIERIRENGFEPVAEVTENTMAVNFRTTVGHSELIVVRLRRDGKFVFCISALQRQPELLTQEFLDDFERRFRQIPGHRVSDAGIRGKPRIELPELIRETGTVEPVLVLLDRFLQHLQ